MLSVVVFLVAVALVPTAVADQAWEVRADFESLKPGDPEVVILRLADGTTVAVPLLALSPESQAAVRRAAAGPGPSPAAGEAGDRGAVTVRGPFGRSVQVFVPDIIKDIESDAIHGRSAEQAADVYRLAIAGDRLSTEQRRAAEDRLREWVVMADKGVVRLGDNWVSREEARSAADEAEKIVAHALELMRLGNADLAEDELRKAARLNPESGRAGFVAGLSYALVARNPAKAIEHFADVVNREPGNAAALCNLAVLEVLMRRYVGVTGHFRDALASTVDRATVSENVAWAVKLAGDAKVVPALAKNRMPDKTVESLNELYRVLTQELRLKPAANVPGPRYLAPDGSPCAAATLRDVAAVFEADHGRLVVEPRAFGFVIATGRVVCPRQVVLAANGSVLDEVAIETSGEERSVFPAQVVAAPADGDVALLACEGLPVEPLPIAARLPSLPEIIAVDRANASWLGARPSAARGKVVTPALQVQASGRFVHTAVVPRGLGGGPIVDEAGRVVGMVAATPFTEASGNAAGFGVPVERILAGLEDHLAVDTAAGADTKPDLGNAERRAAAGTVVVSGRGSRTGSPASRKAESR